MFDSIPQPPPPPPPHIHLNWCLKSFPLSRLLLSSVISSIYPFISIAGIKIYIIACNTCLESLSSGKYLDLWHNFLRWQSSTLDTNLLRKKFPRLWPYISRSNSASISDLFLYRIVIRSQSIRTSFPYLFSLFYIRPRSDRGEHF